VQRLPDSVFFTLPFIQESVSDYKFRLIIYDAEEEVILLWKN